MEGWGLQISYSLLTPLWPKEPTAGGGGGEGRGKGSSSGFVALIGSPPLVGPPATRMCMMIPHIYTL